ncbi:MAG: hypothetical protein JSR48_15255 [Verrucomicrobia bacterium]|nr:hypothetical protein [Verrucomicrobiota bacterium]
MNFASVRLLADLLPWSFAAFGLVALGLWMGRRLGSAADAGSSERESMDADEARALMCLIGELGVGVFSVDRQNGNILADEVAWEMMGGCVLEGVPRQLAARELWRRLPRVDRSVWMTAWREGLDSGLIRHDGRVTGLDGRERHLAIHAEVRSTGSRKIIGACRDLTHLVEIERELAGCQHQVLRVARVTHLGEMAAAIGHELRQPLAKIRFGADTAKSYLCTLPLVRSKVADLLADVSTACTQAEAIIHRVHARTRREPVPFVRLDLNAVVTSALRDLRHHPVMAATTVVPDLAENLPATRGDAVDLRQLFANLVLNAAEAMAALPVEQRVVCVSTLRSAPDEIRVVVMDHGPGISPEAYARLFLPFSTTKATGIGIGLSLCRNIVTDHGGTIAGFNRHDAPGAVFAVTLPVEFHDPDQTPPVRQPAADCLRGG